ncbi:MAG TPA: dTDP-4-dehydrorhamnose reductase [Anaerolineae bacterium]|nr:dTDP-4-dehydrorhamnose reductase [Anaerolineae bacterium]
MRLLVTGAKGMLGTDLCRTLATAGHEFLPTDIQEMDVRDRDLVQRTIADFRPDWVLHLAALTDVDGCEREPDEAFRTNTVGTQNVALACQAAGAGMLYVSTISVFDGSKCEPYMDFDTPNPQSWYSRSKYQGELIVEKLLERYYIVRAGWMFGGGPEDKKFVAKIMELAGQRPMLTIVDDKFGSPTYTRDFAAGILQLLPTALYGAYHMVNTGGYCSRFEFARAILDYAGITTCQIKPVNSAQFPLPAPRPRMEAARNLNLELRGLNWMRPWREALQEYVQQVLQAPAGSDT